jgi:hypothetical protein
MRAIVLAAALAALPAAALANPCGFEERGRMVVTGYGVGQTAVPGDQKAKLAEFAETAKFRDGICVFAQVDKQGSKEANERVAEGRADKVRRFLMAKGVPGDAIRIGRQAKAFTLFGLLPSDQDDDRRVFVTHN